MQALKSARTRSLIKKPRTMHNNFQQQFKEVQQALNELEKCMRETESERRNKEKEGNTQSPLSSSNGGPVRNPFSLFLFFLFFLFPLPFSFLILTFFFPLLQEKKRNKPKRKDFVCTDLDTFSLSGSNMSSTALCSLLQDYHDKGEVKARGCGFTRISFTNCCKVGDTVLEAIATLFGHSVETLVFYKCGLVTDRGLAQLARGCGRLTSVDVRGCVQVTSKGIQQLLVRCKNLDTIFVPKDTLTTEERSQLRRSFPHVRVTLSSQ